MAVMHYRSGEVARGGLGDEKWPIYACLGVVPFGWIWSTDRRELVTCKKCLRSKPIKAKKA